MRNQGRQWFSLTANTVGRDTTEQIMITNQILQ